MRRSTLNCKPPIAASIYSSPLGQMIMTSDGKYLTGLYFAGQKYFPRLFDAAIVQLDIFDITRKWLDEYFAYRLPRFTPPIKLEDIAGATQFRRAVWHTLLAIPYGKTMTYGQIAAIVAKQQCKERMAPQAVGSAVAHNPISIIIPCHRVVGAGGALTGYAGGLDKKQKLLAIESHLLC